MKNDNSSPARIIGSGAFVVSESKRGKLTAFLGTCVGVTICDQFANVGGLIHFLLPHALGSGEPLYPVSYARSGLPLFLQSLYEAGAEKENLTACVAGGALIGEPTLQDLSLNIGGRTADEVEKILREENIPVREMETGGYHGYCLSLNLQTWETSSNRPARRSARAPISRSSSRPKSKSKKQSGPCSPYPRWR